MMKESIGKVATRIILNNPTLSNQQLLDLVKIECPQAVKTSVNCIAWYKSDIKKRKVTLVVERTIETIQEEITLHKMKVVDLEEELKSLTVQTREKLEQEFERLKKLLEV
jgi:hypothetical protein